MSIVDTKYPLTIDIFVNFFYDKGIIISLNILKFDLLGVNVYE